MPNNDDVQWTNKLPAALAGIVLLLAALLATARGRICAAIILAALGLAFVGYSLTIKEWCAMKGTTYGMAPWGQGFGGDFDQCLRAKGWLSF